MDRIRLGNAGRTVALVAALVLAWPAAAGAADPLTVTTETASVQIRSEVRTGGIVRLQVQHRIIVRGGTQPYTVTWTTPTIADGGTYGPQDWPDGLEYGLGGSFDCSVLPSTAHATILDADGVQVVSDALVLPACPASVPSGAFTLAPDPIVVGSPVTLTSGLTNIESVSGCQFFLVGTWYWATDGAFNGEDAAVVSTAPTPDGTDCEPVQFSPTKGGRFNLQAIVFGKTVDGVDTYISFNRDVTINVTTPFAWTLLAPAAGSNTTYDIRGGSVAKVRFSVRENGVPVTDPARIVVSQGGGTCEGAPTSHTKLNTGGGPGGGLSYDSRRGEFQFDMKAPKQAGICWFLRFSIDNTTPLGLWFMLR